MNTGRQIAYLKTATLAVMMVILSPCSAPSLFAQNLPISKNQPMWNAELKKLGARVASKGVVNDPGSFASIAFSRDRLVVAFDTYEPPAAWRFTLAVMDAHTGKLESVQVLPERIEFGSSVLPQVHATPEGDFLVRLPNGLALYSPQLNRLHQTTWSAPRTSEHEYRSVFFSPPGREFGISHEAGEVFEFQIFDAETFQKLADWTGTKSDRPASIADHALVKYPPTDRGGGLAVRTWEGPWHPLCSTDDCKGNPRFLNEETLVLTDPQQGVQVVTVNGEIVLRDKLLSRGQHGYLRPAETSADGQRFAVDFHGPQGRVGWWEELVFKFQKLAVVYDVAAGKVIFALPVRPFPMYWNVELALAPDGSLLAVLNQGKLNVYRLPGK